MPVSRPSLTSLALLLSVMTMAAVGLSHLALVGIGHGESGVLLGWIVVHVTAVMEVALALAPLTLVRRVWAPATRDTAGR